MARKATGLAEAEKRLNALIEKLNSGAELTGEEAGILYANYMLDTLNHAGATYNVENFNTVFEKLEERKGQNQAGAVDYKIFWNYVFFIDAINPQITQFIELCYYRALYAFTYITDINLRPTVYAEQATQEALTAPVAVTQEAYDRIKAKRAAGEPPTESEKQAYYGTMAILPADEAEKAIKGAVPFDYGLGTKNVDGNIRSNNGIYKFYNVAGENYPVEDFKNLNKSISGAFEQLEEYIPQLQAMNAFVDIIAETYTIPNLEKEKQSLERIDAAFSLIASHYKKIRATLENPTYTLPYMDEVRAKKLEILDAFLKEPIDKLERGYKLPISAQRKQDAKNILFTEVWGTWGRGEASLAVEPLIKYFRKNASAGEGVYVK